MESGKAKVVPKSRHKAIEVAETRRCESLSPTADAAKEPQ